MTKSKKINKEAENCKEGEPQVEVEIQDNSESTEEKTTKEEKAAPTKENSSKKSKEKKEDKKKTKKSELEETVSKLNEITDKYMRLSAEFDNYRKRTLKEKMELTRTAGEKILLNILPVNDNFERALNSMDKNSDISAVKEGIDLIYKNFKDFLGQNGVKEIEAINKDFDTDLHEAITKIPAPSEEMKGKIIDCVEKGYKLNDKVIRFAKVVVGE